MYPNAVVTSDDSSTTSPVLPNTLVTVSVNEAVNVVPFCLVNVIVFVVVPPTANVMTDLSYAVFQLEMFVFVIPNEADAVKIGLRGMNISEVCKSAGR